jgi:hypothetical protein
LEPDFLVYFINFVIVNHVESLLEMLLGKNNICALQKKGIASALKFIFYPMHYVGMNGLD